MSNPGSPSQVTPAQYDQVIAELHVASNDLAATERELALTRNKLEREQGANEVLRGKLFTAEGKAGEALIKAETAEAIANDCKERNKGLRRSKRSLTAENEALNEENKTLWVRLARVRRDKANAELKLHDSEQEIQRLGIVIRDLEQR